MKTKTLPAGTTQAQWDRYYADEEAFNLLMGRLRPHRKEYATDAEYQKAYRAWDMACSCDAPNKPGYYRANND